MTEPRRTCVGCRRSAPQDELVRVVRTLDGSLQLGRRLPGRGAWLCAGSLACLDTAVRKKAFTKALRASVTDTATAQLRAQVVGSWPAARD